MARSAAKGSASRLAKTHPQACEGLIWHDPRRAPFRLCGFAWFAQDRVYRRMPLKPAQPLPEAVDNLAWDTAGGQIRFTTNSRSLGLRVVLRSVNRPDHMAQTNTCAFDVYIKRSGSWRYYHTSRGDFTRGVYEHFCFEHPDSEPREFLLNFPQYGGVNEVEVGLEPGAKVSAPAPFALKYPVVLYGTSILQGGCATRPGMGYPNILGRHMHIECINLGFSGSGRGEPEVANAIATIKHVSMFVLDYEANSNYEGLKATLPNFIRTLRAKHPKTPILVLSQIMFGKEHTQSRAFKTRALKITLQREIVEGFRAQGDKHVHFHDGTHLLGADYDECTVDSVHPTDLGFYRMAESLEPVFHKLLFP